jgi:periplasmic protein TonB
MKNAMENDPQRIPDFDDIVFKIRNKEYGAYVLRRNYNRNVTIAIMVSVTIMISLVFIPFLSAKTLENKQRNAERIVDIKLANLDQPLEKVAPPPPPPPPPADVVEQAKYIPPVVVDSVQADESSALMTADEAQEVVRNEEVIEVQEIVQIVEEVETELEPFVIVEEMPEYPGGINELLKWLALNTKYPEVARENNIQGRVFVKFSVTPNGGVDKVSVTKGVDPELDAEALRVVKLLPKFKPGKQGGKPVAVWYNVPILFKIDQD